MDRTGRPMDMRTPTERLGDASLQNLGSSWCTKFNHEQVAPVVKDQFANCYDIRAEIGPIGKPLECSWGIPSTTPEPLPFLAKPFTPPEIKPLWEKTPTLAPTREDFLSQATPIKPLDLPVPKFEKIELPKSQDFHYNKF